METCSVLWAITKTQRLQMCWMPGLKGASSTSTSSGERAVGYIAIQLQLLFQVIPCMTMDKLTSRSALTEAEGKVVKNVDSLWGGWVQCPKPHSCCRDVSGHTVQYWGCCVSRPEVRGKGSWFLEKKVFYCNLGHSQKAKSQILIFGYTSASGENSPSVTVTPLQSQAALPRVSQAHTQQRG